MSVTFLKDNQDLDYSKYENQILIFLYTPLSTDFVSKQIENEAKSSYFQQIMNLGAQMFLVAQEVGPANAANYLLDTEQTIAKSFPEIKNFKNDQTCLIFTKVVDGQLQYLVHRDTPEKEYDWMWTSLQFVKNHQSDQPDPDNNMWKWGQVVQQDGDYLCVDCGYILDFKKGQIFPVCEVCLDGDPSAPDAGPEVGYWELV